MPRPYTMPKIDDILSDPYFIQLDKEVSKFNIFHATDMKNREIKHTKFLGFLLDPNESHQLGTKFLWTFLTKLIAAGVRDLDLISLDTEYTRINIEYNLKGGRIDLLLEIPKGDEITIIAIENKIRAQEGSCQLQTYKNKINTKFPNNPKKYIYLTLDREESSDPAWINVTYADTVIPAIKELLSASKETLSDYLRFVLQNYIEIIEKDENKYDYAMEIYNLINSEVTNKIKEINFSQSPSNTPEYRLQLRYPRAIQYIKDYDTDIRSKILVDFQNLIKKYHKDYPNLRLESSNRNYLRFTYLNPEVQDFLDKGICSEPTTKWLESRLHLAFEIQIRKNENNSIKPLIKIFLGPTNEEFNLRTQLCNKISEKLNQRIFDAVGLIWKSIKTIEISKTTLNKDETNKFIKEELKKLLPSGENHRYAKAINEGIKEFAKEYEDKLIEIGISQEILQKTIEQA